MIRQTNTKYPIRTGRQATIIACCVMALVYAGTSWSKEQPWECVISADGKRWECGRLQPSAAMPLPATTVSPPEPRAAVAAEVPAQPPESAPVAPEPAVTSAPPVQQTEPVVPQVGKSDIQEAEPESAAVETNTTVDPQETVSTQIGESMVTLPATTDAAYSPQMPDLDEGLDSMSCRPVVDVIPQQLGPLDQTLEVEADGGIASPEDETAFFTGNVVLTSETHEIYADDIAYSRKTGEITSQGQLQMRTGDLRIQGERAQFDLNERTGRMHNVEYRIPSQRARGHADLAVMQGQQSGHYENISYTTCPTGNDDFVLYASSLTVDRTNDSATFEDVKVGFLGVPIFYFPKMTLSTSNARKSGLLIPKLGYSSKNGLDLALPYYLNLAPNYDATLIPRVISQRGPALGGEFRFLADKHRGKLLGEILYDRKYNDGEVRGALHMDSSSNLMPNLTGDLLINYVSDDDFLEDLGNSLAVSSTRHLLNQARVTYHADFWDLYGDITHYNTLDDAIAEKDRPYSQLPRIRFDLLKHDGPGNLDYSMLAEYIYFYKDTSMTGHRVDLYPGISFPWRNDWAYVEPAINARYTGYQLQDQPDSQEASQSRSLLGASIDSGMFFDRSSQFFGNSVTQTLEPRAYYVYTPYEDQSDLPVFDTGLLDFSFDNLFRGNRFNGPDRVGDANQIALALSSSVLDDATGEELLRASIGQIYYFEDRRVTLPEDDQIDTSSSSVIAQLSGRISSRWQYRAGVQVDPHADRDSVRQGLAQVVYHGEQNQLFNAAYRLREGVVEQTDLGFVWPLSSNMSMIGRWYYSLQDQQTMEAVAGIEYGRCCWRIRAIMRRYLDNDGLEYTNTALIQLELNGLGKLGHDIDNYLEKSIYGY